ncbi:arabinogalactan endo-1,4-beta-galactosidase [Phaeodactylibacter luteus]|uniref:Arabinogalactan endo-beta-1,4-galactanase n=2 Tax=Phaeodactylibacter luteus TaxID=1564516 RepID=A0A5C6RKX5_9BACT|nr:arabinogalactan endo-1,4-beta-galactosidase [Phaeodactylibacter luteus]
MIMLNRTILSLIAVLMLAAALNGQSAFIRGADLSYVQEMEDCGALFKDTAGNPADPFELFAQAGCDMVRLRLWHTPAWYDTLNSGQRYSDFTDVLEAAQRSKGAGMGVLLDYHLSDFWADPGRQWVPGAWLPVVHDLPALSDSVYQHIYTTLMAMHEAGALPEMVQVGNETNRGILLTQEENDAGWVLDWPRNAALFQAGLQAVSDVESETGQDIRKAIHIAGPTNVGWLMEGFAANDVTGFEVIGLSYYWQWHQPTTIAQTGSIISSLVADYPGKEVMIFETGYPWTMDWADGASNILTDTHPDYAPASPDAQRRWLEDLSDAVAANGGSGVFYWEPAWVSTACSTPWGQGSHKENATFFDFDSRVLEGGGMDWFGGEATTPTIDAAPQIQVVLQQRGQALWVELPAELPALLRCDVYDIGGRGVRSFPLQGGGQEFRLSGLPAGTYVAVVQSAGQVFASKLFEQAGE